jgi:hydroxymethylglutaryl-CoA lyase
MNKLIKFSDVTARDGLQSLGKIISPENRSFLIKNLARLNFEEIEVGSLVNPKIIPTMENSLEVYKQTFNPNNYKSYLLVGNNEGIKVINENNIKYFSIFTSPSNTFNKKNINTDVKGSFKRFQDMIDNLQNRDNHHIKGYISCIGDCPFEGDVPVKNIIDSINVYKKIGVNEICIADTIGSLKPDKLNTILNEVNRIYDINLLSLHLHTNTKTLSDDTTKNNLKIAVNNGVTKFDTSLYGIGGCPAVYCKDDVKSGNLNIFDAVKFLSEFGCSFDKNQYTQEWEEELYQVEENCKFILE